MSRLISQNMNRTAQRSGHGSGDAHRQKEHSETRRETNQTFFSRDDKIDGQRGPNKVKNINDDKTIK